ncbi:M50 family metallopeptidase [Longispora albida]|uniref:M50 family metallopeptidase n=1 Tax=Longispora albida TaxID=203523 RepID=UPI000373ED19|nr:site-2 protease family protein [Longispora albida]
MAFTLGVILFALGIFLAVCLHEAGHMWTAKKFGMKVTRYFAGFGPTLWSFRRGETEYGLKAIPAGGFVKIVGMTPLEEDEEELSEADKQRVFWRKPLWQRTVVLAAGSVTHFIIAFLVLWMCALFFGLPNPVYADAATGKNAAQMKILECVVPANEVRECKAGDPVSPAKQVGLADGVTIVAVAGKPVVSYMDAVMAIREHPAGKTSFTVKDRGASATREVTLDLIAAQRPSLTKKGATVTVSAIGVTGWIDPAIPETVTYGPVDSIGKSAEFYGTIVTGTFEALKKFPEKIPKLWEAITGGDRDADTPISVIGASHIGGQFAERGLWWAFALTFVSLNIFVGIFNLLPLLPLDGGHIAIAWFERARSWLAARRGRPDPGRVDYAKLMPLTYVVIVIFLGFTLLTAGADIINPIKLR